MESYGGPVLPPSEPSSARKFIRKPQVIMRLVAIVCSVVVFGCIATIMDNYDICPYDPRRPWTGCAFGITAGVLAVVTCLVFLLLDVIFDRQSNVLVRKSMVVADLAFSALWAVLWLSAFSLLADRWRKYSDTIDSWPYQENIIPHNSRAAITFSFFSILVWVALTVYACFRLYKGPGQVFSEPVAAAVDPALPPWNFGGQPIPTDSFMQPPFTGENYLEVPNFQPVAY